MRIVIDARYLDGTYSGIATYSRFLIEHIAKIDQENEYFILIRPKFKQHLDVGDNFEFLTCKYPVVSFQTLFSFHRQIEELEPDLVHTLAPLAPIFYNGPLIVTLHDLQPMIDPDFHSQRPRLIRNAYRLFYLWAYPTVLAQAKWVLCDSVATRDDAVRLYPGLRSKLIVCHPGLGPLLYLPTENQTEAIVQKLGLQHRYFLYYGSTRPNKNLRNLIRAFAEFNELRDQKDEIFQLVLVLKTDRFFEEIKAEIKKLKLDPFIRVTEPLEMEAHRALLRGSQALLFPTKYEGFGFPPLEAMQLGVPVLASTSGSLPEVTGDHAVLVDPDDTEEIARGIKRLAEDEDTCRWLASKGPQRADLFQWSDTAQTIHDVYRLLV